MRILGLSTCRDSAAALIDDGAIVAAAQEERFTRRKAQAGVPAQAIAYCLGEAGCGPDGVDSVALHGTPAPEIGRLLRARFPQVPIHSVKHALSHAAAAFFPSPFDTAAVLVLDGPGAAMACAVALGSRNRLEIRTEMPGHALGALYSAFTGYVGFKVNGGEYKMMGLAPYGEPRYLGLIRERLAQVAEDGGLWLEPSLSDPETAVAPLAALFGQPARRPDAEPLTRFHMDVAASVQAFIEVAIIRLARAIRAETGARNLCLAGDVALNCVANGRLLREKVFDDLWIQPAAGDAGGALGAALAVHHLVETQPRPGAGDGRDRMCGSYLGPAWSQTEVERRLGAVGARFAVLDDDALLQRTADALEREQAVGWVQGRMEFGPRSLGNRSILGDARSPTMQKVLNLKVKYRESFRPFAPSVLREDVAEWFELDGDSPYMLLVAPVAEKHRRTLSEDERNLCGIDRITVPRSAIPAVTHVDHSARVQTVHADTNPRFHALIAAFKARTGCGVLVNTSFNVRGEPIVCTPEDAFRCFMGNEIEVLVVGNCFLRKQDQDAGLKLDYRTAFEPD